MLIYDRNYYIVPSMFMYIKIGSFIQCLLVDLFKNNTGMFSHHPPFLQMISRYDSSPQMVGRPKGLFPRLMFIAK